MDESVRIIVEALADGAAFIVVLLVGAFATGLSKWIEVKSKQLAVEKSVAESALITDVASAVIKFIDQKKVDLDNDEKAVKALLLSKSILNKRAPSIDIDDDELEAVIEAALNDLRVGNQASIDDLTPVIGFHAVPSEMEEYWDDEDGTEEETGTKQTLTKESV